MQDAPLHVYSSSMDSPAPGRSKTPVMLNIRVFREGKVHIQIMEAPPSASVPSSVIHFGSASETEPSLYAVKCIFILDKDGNRLLSKYYDLQLYPTLKEQKRFETQVYNKTHNENLEIAFLEGMTVVYKSSIDLLFYVAGSNQENELMLLAVLNCLFESISHVLKTNVEKKNLLSNMDGLFLVVDEIIDGGIILECDPQQILQKVNHQMESEGSPPFRHLQWVRGPYRNRVLLRLYSRQSSISSVSS